MIFKEIELNNFRQFRGTQILTFDTANERRINLVIASNGTGKTTLLQAVRFCFFGENKNVLKLDKRDELLNYTAKNNLAEAKTIEVSVKVRFVHNQRDYIAIRSISYQKWNGKLKRNGDTKFSLQVADDPINGYIDYEKNSQVEMLKIMPIELAPIYMFEGERLEKPITSPEFRKMIQVSINGILGLGTLAESINLLGEKNIRTSILGKISSKFLPNSQSEEEVLRQENEYNNQINASIVIIKDRLSGIEKLTADIDETIEIQNKIKEVKELNDKKNLLASTRREFEEKRKTAINTGTKLAIKLLYKIELAKTYQKFIAFQKSGENVANTTIYDGLHANVINAIKEKKLCICGREICDGTPEWDFLTSLAVLPHDNTQYIMGIEGMYRQLESDTANWYLNLENFRIEKLRLGREIKDYNSEIASIDAQIEAINKVNNLAEEQVNVRSLEKSLAIFKATVAAETKKKEVAAKNLLQISNKIKKIQTQSDTNIRVSKALELLNGLKNNLEQELEHNKVVGKNSIEANMAGLVEEIMQGNFKISLSDDYRLKIERRIEDQIGNEFLEDETNKLSTGQNIVLYLIFIRSLFSTIQGNAEFKDSSNGIIMDAALSNLDGDHIALIGRNILTKFDQLIFLSFSRQIRDELINGVSENIGKVYFLDKDNNSNIQIKELAKNKLLEHIEIDVKGRTHNE